MQMARPRSSASSGAGNPADRLQTPCRKALPIPTVETGSDLIRQARGLRRDASSCSGRPWPEWLARASSLLHGGSAPRFASPQPGNVPPQPTAVSEARDRSTDAAESAQSAGSDAGPVTGAATPEAAGRNATIKCTVVWHDGKAETQEQIEEMRLRREARRVNLEKIDKVITKMRLALVDKAFREFHANVSARKSTLSAEKDKLYHVCQLLREEMAQYEQRLAKSAPGLQEQRQSGEERQSGSASDLDTNVKRASSTFKRLRERPKSALADRGTPLSRQASAPALLRQTSAPPLLTRKPRRAASACWSRPATQDIGTRDDHVIVCVKQRLRTSSAKRVTLGVTEIAVKLSGSKISAKIASSKVEFEDASQQQPSREAVEQAPLAGLVDGKMKKWLGDARIKLARRALLAESSAIAFASKQRWSQEAANRAKKAQEDDTPLSFMALHVKPSERALHQSSLKAALGLANRKEENALDLMLKAHNHRQHLEGQKMRQQDLVESRPRWRCPPVPKGAAAWIHS